MIDVDIRVGRLPEALDDFAPGDFQAVFSDPPYGLGKLGPGRLRAMLNAWLDGREGTQTAGMLGREWDVVIGPPTWERLRHVTSPGALVFAYSHARTVHLQTLAMQLAGWQILPQWTRIHGGAMALGQDVSKAIDKAAGAEREVVGTKSNPTSSPGVYRSGAAAADSITAPATPLARRFDGYNTAVRAVTEPIVSAVNPPSGPWASNAAEHGCGGFNVGDNRIPSGPDHARNCATAIGHKPPPAVAYGSNDRPRGDSYDPRGRFPSNVILEHAAGCGADWCVEGCPVRLLGEQSGESPDVTLDTRNAGPHSLVTGGKRERVKEVRQYSGGTAARFYYQGRASREERHRGAEGLLWRRAPSHPDGWELIDLDTFDAIGAKAEAKARASERYAELMAPGYMRTVHKGGKAVRVLDVDHEDAAAYVKTARNADRFVGSPHLAVKAADGGSHLAGLLRQPDPEARILIPYAGTGSEIIAAMLAGWRRIVAVEMSDQWAAVARRRVAWWQQAIESGSRGEALAILRDWGTASGEAPVEDEAQLSLFMGLADEDPA